MDKRRLLVEREFLFDGDWSALSGYRAFLHFNRLRPRPSAVIAANDHMAIGFVQAAHEYGVNIPADVSLAGIDDIEMASFATPKLTTMRQPMGVIAYQAVEALIGAIHDKTRPASRVILKAEPVLRDSCGPCSG
jgi:LacI family transcriptional regulator